MLNRQSRGHNREIVIDGIKYRAMLTRTVLERDENKDGETLAAALMIVCVHTYVT